MLRNRQIAVASSHCLSRSGGFGSTSTRRAGGGAEVRYRVPSLAVVRHVAVDPTPHPGRQVDRATPIGIEVFFCAIAYHMARCQP